MVRHALRVVLKEAYTSRMLSMLLRPAMANHHHLCVEPTCVGQAPGLPLRQGLDILRDGTQEQVVFTGSIVAAANPPLEPPPCLRPGGLLAPQKTRGNVWSYKLLRSAHHSHALGHAAEWPVQVVRMMGSADASSSQTA
jgi:hypothetical protein